MGSRTKAFGLIIFTPDVVQTNTGSNELLIGGEGMTVRIALDAFIEHVDWSTLATHYGVWRAEQDRLRKEAYERSKGESLDVPSFDSGDYN